MRVLGRILAVVLLLIVVAVASTFSAATLPVGPAPAGGLPAATPPPGMSLSALPTGAGKAGAAFAYRGGGLLDEREFAMTAVLVRHPRGDLLIDAGFGRGAREHLAAQSALLRATARYQYGTAAADQLGAGGYPVTRLAGVLLTHAHWDHVSGLDALPGTPVWVNRDEHAFIESGDRGAAVIRAIAPRRYVDYGFDGPPLLGFPGSHDVWGDGAIVALPAPGHTPGSTVILVTLPSGRRFAFLGDLAWQTEGVELPAERPFITRQLVDQDAEGVRRGLGQVAAIHRAFPAITLLPAHDGRAFARLPVFPASLD